MLGVKKALSAVLLLGMQQGALSGLVVGGVMGGVGAALNGDNVWEGI